ncbi:MAG: Gfo/Idh/MocA family oxidoreductase [Candidatus Omnitrophica bacterium]|nr:Gfo/Idh/MocA family oxidoreductase [Candidatus Omnitrophota bacterium]
MIKVGIIGFGKMGKIRAHAIKANALGQIVSIFEVDKNLISDEYPFVESVDDIFNNEDINTLFICTPNYLNKDLTIRSLQAGKHVFCEKPPAFNEQDMQAVIAVEKKTDTKLMYGFNHRHHTSIKHIKHLIDSGEYGNILWMRGRYGKSTDTSFFDTWRAKKKLAGGGILLDQGIHMLDLFLCFAKDFHETHSFVSNLYWKLEIEDNVFAILRNNNNGIVASLHSTMTQWRHLFSLEIFLEKGYFVLNGLKTSSGTYGDEILTIAKNRSTAPAATWEDEEKIVYQTDRSWRSEIDYFFDAILKDTPIEVGNSLDALKLMAITDKLYQERT